MTDRARARTPERWERIAEIFHTALERAAEDRAAYVEVACGTDAELRAEVTALLSAYGAGPLDALAAVVPERLQAALPDERDSPPPPAPGARVGPYRLVDRIGSGGMGVVYLAERDEPGFEQRVALKLLRSGVAGTDVVGRFLTERRILARLEHPNVTRLLDGGVTPDGLPYFAMEHVEGVPIDRFCDGGRLTVRERLALFVGVCEAMQYAHSHLVVHRDVKPSNILVTRDRTVKVLDFGIAKLLDDREVGGGLTRTGQRWLTPEYASPEQVRGEPVTTASDVYGLGVVLYELLSGRRPYDVAGRSRHDVERAVLESEPSRPSAAVRTVAAGQPTTEQLASTRSVPPARLRRQLTGDLDTIVLKSLQKHPGRRYATAGELAEDVRLHLAGLPVRARPDTVAYRVGKFVRRHRVGVAASVLLALALAGGAGGTLWQARRATLQARVAAEEAATAQQVSAFLVSLFESADPGETGGEQLPVGELLERGVAQAEEELSGRPAVQADMLDAIGKAYQNLGEYERARPLFVRALELRRAAYGPEHDAVAEGLNDLAVVLHYGGDVDAAQATYEEAVALRRLLVEEGAGEDADSLRADLASTLASLAALHAERRQFEESERLYAEAIDLAEGVFGADHLRTALIRMGSAMPTMERGDLDEAEAVLSRTLVSIRSHHGGDHPDVYRAQNNLAAVVLEQGRLAEAERLFRASLEMRRRIYGDDHPDVAAAIQNLGAVAAEMGQPEEAASLYREALAMRRRLLPPQHPDVTYTLSSLGLLLHDGAECGAALPPLEESREGGGAPGGGRHPLALKTQGLLGDCLARLGRYERAEHELLESYAALDSLVGAGHGETRRVAGFLAELYAATGDAERAERFEALAEGPGR